MCTIKDYALYPSGIKLGRKRKARGRECIVEIEVEIESSITKVLYSSSLHFRERKDAIKKMQKMQVFVDRFHFILL